MAQQAPREFTATVSSVVHLTPSVILASFVPADGHLVGFAPGQYMTVIIEPTVRRQYSICSSADRSDGFELVADTSPGGVGSKWFQSLTVGAAVRMLGPLGSFVPDETSARRRVLVATGTGIAPFRSQLLTLRGRAPDRRPAVSLYWGLRHTEDMYWDDEFRTLAAELGFRYTFVLSQPSEGWTGNRGHVTEYVLSGETDYIASDFYLCGNKTMIAELEANLQTLGVPAGQIKKDVFF